MAGDRRVALVTGAGAGIGEASALELARSGSDAVIIDVRQAELDRLAAQIHALGREAERLAKRHFSESTSTKSMILRGAEPGGPAYAAIADEKASTQPIWRLARHCSAHRARSRSR